MVDDQDVVWRCVSCRNGKPSGELKPGVAENFATGSCDNLACPSKSDKGATKQKGGRFRPPRVATFRRINATQERTP